MEKMMKAAVFTGIEKMEIRDVPVPKVPQGGMLVKVMACGICGSDIRNFHNGLRADVKEQIMGHEIAGVVEKTDEGVTGFRAGDNVTVSPDVSCGKCFYCKRGWVNLCENHRMVGTHWPGGFAQYIALPEEVMTRGMVLLAPQDINYRYAALTEPLSSVLAAQINHDVGAGDTVVILGDGPIGCMHLEVARMRGAKKIIMVGLARLKEAEGFAPDVLLDARQDDVVRRVLEETDGRGADVAITANPVAKTHAQAVEMVRKRGTVILFGGLPKKEPMSTINANRVHYGEITIAGAFSYTKDVNQKALEAICEHKISVEKIANKVVGLDAIEEGIRAASSGEAMKVIVDTQMIAGEGR